MIPAQLHAFAASLIEAGLVNERPAPAAGLAAVLDTHVLMDCFHWGNAASGPVREALESGAMTALECRDTFLELAGVLSRPQFGADEAHVREVLERTARRVRFVPQEAMERAAPTLSIRCRDPEDQKFLTLAVAGGARVLITRDRLLLKAAKRLRARGVEPMTPETFARSAPAEPSAT